MHLAGGEDRLVVKRRAVERRRDDLAHVVDGDDAADAGLCARCAHVETGYAAMRDRRAENLAVKHARQAHVVDVFGAAGDLRLAFEPSYGTPNRPAADGACRHQPPPPFIAAMSARRTYTRRSSDLYAAEP